MRLLPAIAAALATAVIALAPLSAQTAGTSVAAPGAVPPAATALVGTAPPAPTKAEIVCRRSQVTGSLVQWTKACHTRAQWLVIDGQHNALARQMVDDGTTRPGGN